MDKNFISNVIGVLIIISIIVLFVFLDIKNRQLSKKYKFYKQIKMRIEKKECIYSGKGGSCYTVTLYDKNVRIKIEVDKNTYKLCGKRRDLFPYEILVYQYNDLYTGLVLTNSIKNKLEKLKDNNNKENIIYHKLLTRTEKIQVVMLFIIIIVALIYILK